MRVLLANKFFYRRAGAETVFFRTRELLERHGHEVVDFAMKDERNLASPQRDMFAPARAYDSGRAHERVRDAAASIYSFNARRALARVLDTTCPDIAHLHNIYHQLSLSIVDELAARRIPTVLTVHDYKPVCPSYVLYTEGAPCRRCVQGSPVNAIKHRCVKNSYLPSGLAAIEAVIARRRGTYERIDQFIAPSRFFADRLAEGGVGRGRVTVLANCVSQEPMRPAPDRSPGRYLLYVGRLEELKGVKLLLDAYRRLGAGCTPLRVLGSGPLEDEVVEAGAQGLPVEFLGFRSGEGVRAELGGAIALVVPSLVEENCPMSILEARELAVPVISSDRGGLPEVVRDGIDGLVFAGGDAADLVRCIVELASDPDRARSYGTEGRRRALDEFSSDGYYRGLLDVYARAVEAAR